ncbi:hypothetical protein N431DRAFT_436641 [Stipitochalara longipes BDJ]|nr:hypothetical protein N431DRAFT_436641 [Stipitochalara longipes BDJ]
MTSPLPTQSRLISFSLFPTLPSELQQQIWRTLTSLEAQQRGSQNHRIAPDATSPKRSSIDDPSDIQFRIINQPHYLPKYFQVCANSREISQRMYTRWERYNGGYIYVNEATDMFHFAGRRPKFFWYLDASIAHSREEISSDEAALSQFKKQLKGVRHLAFDYFLWRELYHETRPDESHFFFSHTFPDAKALVVTLPSHLPGVGDEMVSDRRYKYLELDDLMIRAGSALKRHGQFLGLTFSAVKKSYPASSVPVLKTAIHVKEREYKDLPEERRFTCVYSRLESEIAPSPIRVIAQ